MSKYDRKSSAGRCTTSMQATAAEDHFFEAWHLFGNLENDEITCHRNNALYCVALPGSQHEVRRAEISSLYSKHGLMDLERR